MKRWQKNIALSLISVSLLQVATPIFYQSVIHAEKKDTIETHAPFVVDLGFEDKDTKVVIVYENGKINTIKYNYAKYYFEVNGEKYYSNSISFRTSTDWSSGRYISGVLPWKGSIHLLTSLVTMFFGGKIATAVANGLVGLATGDAENIYYSYVQYKSEEDYWSDYNNTYYKKYISRDIKFYIKEISPHNIISGPHDGDWYDPIRPF